MMLLGIVFLAAIVVFIAVHIVKRELDQAARSVGSRDTDSHEALDRYSARQQARVQQQALEITNRHAVKKSRLSR